jgi:hypothetical protein
MGGECLWIPPPDDEEDNPCRPFTTSSLDQPKATSQAGKVMEWQQLFVDSPGSKWIRTPTILSMELKTRLHRHTISAHANGPCTIVDGRLKFK